MMFSKKIIALFVVFLSCNVLAVEWKQDQSFMNLFFEGWDDGWNVVDTFADKHKKSEQFFKITLSNNVKLIIKTESLVNLSTQFDQEMRTQVADYSKLATLCFASGVFGDLSYLFASKDERGENIAKDIKDYCSKFLNLFKDLEAGNFAPSHPYQYECSSFGIATNLIFDYLNPKNDVRKIGRMIFVIFSPEYAGKFDLNELPKGKYPTHIKKICDWVKRFIDVAIFCKLKCYPERNFHLVKKIADKEPVCWKKVSDDKYAAIIAKEFNDASFISFVLNATNQFMGALSEQIGASKFE